MQLAECVGGLWLVEAVIIVNQLLRTRYRCGDSQEVDYGPWHNHFRDVMRTRMCLLVRCSSFSWIVVLSYPVSPVCYKKVRLNEDVGVLPAHCATNDAIDNRSAALPWVVPIKYVAQQITYAEGIYGRQPSTQCAFANSFIQHSKFHVSRRTRLIKERINVCGSVCVVLITVAQLSEQRSW